MDWSSVQEWLKGWRPLAGFLAAAGVLGTFWLGWFLARRDRARLYVVPRVEVGVDTVPPRLTLDAELVNRGRRRIVVHRYGLEQPWFTVLGVDVPPWREVFERDLKSKINLKEADHKKATLRTPQAALASARRIWFRDTRGKKWRRWRFRRYRKLAGPALIKRGTVDPLQERAFGEPVDQRSAHLALYPPSSEGKDYRIQLRMLDRGRYYLWRFDSKQSTETAWPKTERIAELHHREGVDPTVNSWGHPTSRIDPRGVKGARSARGGPWEDRLPRGS